MTLYELAFVCYFFNQTDRREYEDFIRDTNRHPDLFDANHREALLMFLNRWGCRHIARIHHEQASEEIAQWYEIYNGQFFDNDINLWELGEEHLALANEAHQYLSERFVTPEKRFGATAAAKALFAIRPNAFVPWDNAIRKGGQYDSYLEFMRQMRETALNLAQECERHGFELNELPGRLGTPGKTIPKLIDENNWMTIPRSSTPADEQTLRRSRSFTPADEQTLRRWLNWYH